jgi:hypothetical protein
MAEPTVFVPAGHGSWAAALALARLGHERQERSTTQHGSAR